MPIFSFRKDEILRKKKLIDQLFAEGNSFFTHPFKVFFLIMPGDTTFRAQVMITVGKRSFKRAVDRNRIRRQIKEAYRINKDTLYKNLALQNKHCILAIIYTANNAIPAEILDTKIKAVFKRLDVEIGKTLNNPSPFLSTNKTM